MIKLLFTAIITLAFCCSGYSQQYDKLELRDGKVYMGKVEKIKTDIVEFKDSDTGLLYEYNKYDIRYIALANGKILTFDQIAPKQTDNVKTDNTPPVVEQDSGSNTGLVILAAIGGTLALLLLIGAIASAGN